MHTAAGPGDYIISLFPINAHCACKERPSLVLGRGDTFDLPPKLIIIVYQTTHPDIDPKSRDFIVEVSGRTLGLRPPSHKAGGVFLDLRRIIAVREDDPRFLPYGLERIGTLTRKCFEQVRTTVTARDLYPDTDCLMRKQATPPTVEIRQKRSACCGNAKTADNG